MQIKNYEFKIFLKNSEKEIGGLMFNNKINVLKALVISLIVSGHLELTLIPMFPPYSFHLALFFFISGYLFKEKYIDNVFEFIKKRVKSLLVPYYLYIVFYLLITIFIEKLTGRFWGKEITLKNFIITPFVNGHQLDLTSPLWFVTQLFITLIAFLFVFRQLRKISTNKWFHLIVFFILSLIPTYFVNQKFGSIDLVLVKTAFSLFFVYLGYFYKNYIEGKLNIFSAKIFWSVLIIQSLLWLTNKDYTADDGVGLSYILAWGNFDDFLIPILTSLSGIWICLFIVEYLYPYIKDNKFIYHMGQNTYHIMANHLFVFYLITVCLMAIKGIPISIRNEHNIYWIVLPLKTSYFYFVVAMIATTYIGVALKAIKNHLFKKH